MFVTTLLLADFQSSLLAKLVLFTFHRLLVLASIMSRVKNQVKHKRNKNYCWLRSFDCVVYGHLLYSAKAPIKNPGMSTAVQKCFALT